MESIAQPLAPAGRSGSGREGGLGPLPSLSTDLDKSLTAEPEQHIRNESLATNPLHDPDPEQQIGMENNTGITSQNRTDSSHREIASNCIREDKNPDRDRPKSINLQSDDLTGIKAIPRVSTDSHRSDSDDSVTIVTHEKSNVLSFSEQRRKTVESVLTQGKRKRIESPTIISKPKAIPGHEWRRQGTGWTLLRYWYDRTDSGARMKKREYVQHYSASALNRAESLRGIL